MVWDVIKKMVDYIKANYNEPIRFKDCQYEDVDYGEWRAECKTEDGYNAVVRFTSVIDDAKIAYGNGMIVSFCSGRTAIFNPLFCKGKPVTKMEFMPGELNKIAKSPRKLESIEKQLVQFDVAKSVEELKSALKSIEDTKYTIDEVKILIPRLAWYLTDYEMKSALIIKRRCRSELRGLDKAMYDAFEDISFKMRSLINRYALLESSCTYIRSDEVEDEKKKIVQDAEEKLRQDAKSWNPFLRWGSITSLFYLEVGQAYGPSWIDSNLNYFDLHFCKYTDPLSGEQLNYSFAIYQTKWCGPHGA